MIERGLFGLDSQKMEFSLKRGCPFKALTEVFLKGVQNATFYRSLSSCATQPLHLTLRAIYSLESWLSHKWKKEQVNILLHYFNLVQYLDVRYTER